MLTILMTHRSSRQHPPGKPLAANLARHCGEEAQFPVRGVCHDAEARQKRQHVHEDDKDDRQHKREGKCLVRVRHLARQRADRVPII